MSTSLAEKKPGTQPKRNSLVFTQPFTVWNHSLLTSRVGKTETYIFATSLTTSRQVISFICRQKKFKSLREDPAFRFHLARTRGCTHALLLSSDKRDKELRLEPNLFSVVSLSACCWKSVFQGRILQLEDSMRKLLRGNFSSLKHSSAGRLEAEQINVNFVEAFLVPNALWPTIIK